MLRQEVIDNKGSKCQINEPFNKENEASLDAAAASSCIGVSWMLSEERVGVCSSLNFKRRVRQQSRRKYCAELWGNMGKILKLGYKRSQQVGY